MNNNIQRIKAACHGYLRDKPLLLGTLIFYARKQSRSDAFPDTDAETCKQPEVIRKIPDAFKHRVLRSFI